MTKSLHQVVDALVIGGGITGLVLAYSLKKQGKSVALCEASGKVGGVISSERIGGFLLEHGPNSFIANEKITSLIHSLGLTSQVVSPEKSSHIRYLARGNSLVATPGSPQQAISTALLTMGGKCRALCDLVLPKMTAEDASVDGFFRHRFGRSVAEDLIAPMITGIWAADPKKLSLRSAFPQIWQMAEEHRSLLLAAKRTMSKERSKRRIISFTNGLEELTSRLEAELGESVFLQTKVLTLSKLNSGVSASLSLSNDVNETQEILANKVFITCDASSASKLIDPLDASLSRELSEIPYAPLGVLHFKLTENDTDKPKGFGFLVAPNQKRTLLGALFSSEMFPGRASSEHQLITCFVGSALHPENANPDDRPLQSKVIEELRELLRLENEPELLSTTHYARAIPNYPLGHFKIIQQTDAFEEAHSNIALVGNWRDGVSIGNRIESALSVAEKFASER